jgi:hypothetical protein
MKKQIKSNWQKMVFAAIAAVVFMFAANSTALAQTTYKVGDRAEKLSAGEWVEVEIIEVKDGGQYVVRFVKSGISGAWYDGKELRPIKANAQTGNQNNADKQVQNQTDGNNRADNETPTPNPAQTNKTNRFGARDARTCENTKAPAKGAITAALALKYLNCQMEGIWSNDLYLVENVKVEVGGGVPYAAIMGQYSLDQIDVKYPVYPIRGSFLKYQCQDPETAYVGPPNTNCVTYNNPKATGYCYKTTFGDWKCNMVDRSATEKENYREKVAPPKSLKL